MSSGFPVNGVAWSFMDVGVWTESPSFDGDCEAMVSPHSTRNLEGAQSWRLAARTKSFIWGTTGNQEDYNGG